MGTSIKHLIKTHQRVGSQSLSSLVEDLWTYRLMPDFPYEVAALCGDPYEDGFVRLVAEILHAKKDVTRIDCPCCQVVTKSRFVESVDRADQATMLCYLCEACGNVISMKPIAIGQSTHPAVADGTHVDPTHLHADKLEYRPPLPTESDLIGRLIPQLSRRAKAVLEIHDLGTINHLCRMSKSDIRSLKLSGTPVVEEFREGLAGMGRSLGDDRHYLDGYLATRFLDAIYASPEADEPRLAFAQWLEENELARGEFIRAQIKLAKMSEFDANYHELKAREATLLEQNEEAWLFPWGECVGKVRCDRGFPHSVSIDPPEDDRIEDLLRDFPLIRQLKLGCTSHKHRHQLEFWACAKGYYTKLLGQPWVSQLMGLSLRDNCVGDVAAKTLASSQYASNLQWLDLSVNMISDDGADALATSSHLSSLQLLDLTDNPIGEAAAARLRDRFGNRVRLKFGCYSMSDSSTDDQSRDA